MSAVVAIVGGQYGSEGKGEIAHYLADEFMVHVRSGGPNAGHTFTHGGRRWPMQQVPCGWTNSLARLVLSAGALVSLEVLKREMDAIAEFEGSSVSGVRLHITERVIVDSHAGIITEEQRRVAGGVDGEAHRRYGSTGEGVGVARMARLLRDRDSFKRAEDMAELPEYVWLRPLLMPDTARMLNRAAKLPPHDAGMPILLEGTQGVGLSVVHGTWPYCTNHDTGAAQMLADAGIAPGHLTDTIMVFRTFPIRVAGNSGPLPGETTWEEMSKIVGREVLERTTVTKKPRRIGTWDWDLAEYACTLNSPSGLALTFLDYMFPESAGVNSWDALCTHAPQAAGWVKEVESRLGVPAWFVCTGPGVIIDRRPSLNRRPGWSSWHRSIARDLAGTTLRTQP